MKIALVGSPNVGKSAIFNCLTGRYAVVSNYPGTTVEVTRGNAKAGEAAVEIIDTPGLYSIFPITEEERVTLKILTDERPDLIIHIIDAKNLERMLPLTFQLVEMGFPVVVALNMFDEALALGMNIDTSLLSGSLGLPVVATVAVENRGIGQLVKTIETAISNPPIPPLLKGGEGGLPAFSESLMKGWYRKASDICRSVIKRKEARRSLSRLDKILISPVSGSVILAIILYFGLYKFVGGFGAGTVVDLLEGGFVRYINPAVTRITEAYIPWHAVQGLLVGEYGIITLGIRYAVAIILPIVFLFFLVFAVIEDSGYLPRLAYLLDRIFKKIGLSGKAVIPMVLGLGCDTMATMVTRTLPTRRERLIATLLLALCIPCSAQMGVILGLLAGTPYVLAAWLFIIIFIFAFVGRSLSRLVPGAGPSFVLEVPPLRVPQIRNVLVKTYARMEWYFKEIIPLFILASILIWLGQITGLFRIIVDWMSRPLALMGLPPQSASAFLFGFFRRDYGAAGLYDIHRAGVFTNNQLLVAVVVLTLFLPCITQFLITIKERGWKIGLGISVFVLLFAFFAGVVLNYVISTLHIVF